MPTDGIASDRPGGKPRRPRAPRSGRPDPVAVVLAMLLGGCLAPGPSSPTQSPGSAATPRATATADLSVPSQPVQAAVPFPLEATIPEIQAAMDRGDLTSVGLVDFFLARIAAYEDAGPTLNAYILVNPRAREEAAALDAERAATGPRGPLHGIPIAIKDNIGTAHMPTTAGSLALDGFVPSEDAYQVRRLRDAGAIILGKTNLYDFANGWTSVSSLGGQTLSPYDITRDPGGSSGGSAVAVSANLAAIGFGTDSCGSVRHPAVLNDLFGLRPTEGLTSRSGVIPLSPTLDTMAPMARSVIDLAIALDATAGVDPADPTTVPVDAAYVDAVDPGGLAGRRVGVLRHVPNSETRALIDQAIDDLRTAGVEIVEVELPSAVLVYQAFDEFDSALDAYFASQPTSPVRSFRALRAFFEAHPDADYADLLSITDPISLDTDDYRASIADRPVFRDAIVAIMDEHDLDAIAYPESRSAAPQIGDRLREPWGCWIAPHAGLPALAMPIGFTTDGLPIGIELMGRPFNEATLIAMAAGYEARTDHRVLPPTTPPLP